MSHPGSGGSIDINIQLSLLWLVTPYHQPPPASGSSSGATIVVSIIHIPTGALTQLHNLLTKILMGLLMRMLDHIITSRHFTQLYRLYGYST